MSRAQSSLKKRAKGAQAYLFDEAWTQAATESTLQLGGELAERIRDSRSAEPGHKVPLRHSPKRIGDGTEMRGRTEMRGGQRHGPC